MRPVVLRGATSLWRLSGQRSARRWWDRGSAIESLVAGRRGIDA